MTPYSIRYIFLALLLLQVTRSSYEFDLHLISHLYRRLTSIGEQVENVLPLFWECTPKQSL